MWQIVLLVVLTGQVVCADEQSVRVLIYSGSNNHNWQQTTPAIKNILTKAGISSDVIDKPGNVTDQILSKYDVIVSNWNNFNDKGLDWSDESKHAFIDFIHKGGGHVTVHAGGSSFADWPEYHQIVASWGKQTSHGPQHEFAVSIEQPDHPICQGIKPFRTKDELWRKTKFPAGSKVLMRAKSSKETGGDGSNEPILAVSQFGSGRCVNFLLGHDVNSMANTGFETVLAQSVLWAGGVKPQNMDLKWVKTEQTIALKNNNKTVWQFNHGKTTSKPCFHPVSLLDGTVITEDRPGDHPWHHALWFSWKYINGVNFWEEDRQTGKSEGETDWKDVKVVTRKNYSATITMNLTYNHGGQGPILTEKRRMEVSAPNSEGSYSIDWTSEFKACSDIDVTFDRTPLAGEPGGKPWGGYAGLSVRLNGKGSQWTVSTEKAPVKLDGGTFRGKAKAMDYSGVFDGQAAGIAILDHPENLNAPSPWYAINNNPMKYFSPAVICYKPHKLSAGQTFTLRYRIIVHPQKWDADKLETQIDKYIPVQDKQKKG